jgi:NADH dehydrogenase
LKAVEVDESLAVPNVQGVWAVGDCAEIPKPGKKGSYAKTAQNATREGRLAAQNIFRQLRGEPAKPFRYKPIGQLALVGNHKGIAEIYGLRFSGLIAYMMWRAIYIAKMPSMSQRLRVISDWLLDVTLGPPAEYHADTIPASQKKLIAAQH